ncbi:MAG TPA: MBOAT family O-acyltransferase [Longimicrobium sp.]|nr:MBOAT family O-acyltransferase [Longimicrobium sp.]
MLFNSLAFALFFPTVVLLFFATPHRWRWVVLLAASYLFYGWWKFEYLLLLMATTGADWWAGIRMEDAATPGRRKAWLGVSLLGNLGMLGYFKYAGFVHDTVASIASPLGIVLEDSAVFHPLLPVGISFYVFQSLAYTIDVYRGDIPAERHLGRFALYVSFFPQLVAGPIERAGRLLPQFYVVQRFHGGRAVAGLTLMGWGFFQKVVIADRLAPYVNESFAPQGAQTAGAVLLAAYFFYFQIYADFSGYTDIARGAAMVMGFSLMLNFDRAYLATSMSEVFRRWHISLMIWFRDYLARPLGWSRPGRPKWARNILIVFLASGLWHGAAWTFIAWGASTAVLIIVGDGTRRRRDRLWQRAQRAADGVRAGAGQRLGQARTVLACLFIVNLMSLTLIFFRAPSMGRAVEMYGTLFGHPATLVSFGGLPLPAWQLAVAIAALTLFLVVDGVGHARQWPERFAAQPRWMRWSAAYAIGIAVLMFGEFGLVPFYYFQF